MFLILNIIPGIAFMSETYFFKVFEIIKNNFEIGDIEFTFMIRWGLGAVFSALLLAILFLPYKYWKNKEQKRALDYKYMTFCNAFTLRKNLKNYLINSKEIHLEKSVKFFNDITHWIINASIETDNKSSTIKIDKLENELRKQFEWFSLSIETKEIISSFSQIKNKITERLNRKTEIDKILPLIDLLTMYHFAKIMPIVVDDYDIKIGDKKVEFIKSFSIELNNLEEVQKTCESDGNKNYRFNKFLKALNSFFYDSNIIIMFMLWGVLLSLIFVPVVTLVISFQNIEIDSTILIGLFTVPFIGAITFAATIYTKRQK